MSLTTRVGLLAGAAAVSVCGLCHAETSTNADALAQIAQLKAEVAQLKAQTGDNWLTDQRAAEIRSVVQDVLADADTRASLQGSGMTAGWDKGFFLASPDGNYRLQIQGQIQFRYAYTFRDDSGADDNVKGFENRRTKLTFKGNVVDKTWKYNLRGNFSEDGGSFGLENAYIQKDLGEGFSVIFGQWKPPVLREELVESYYQLAVERSLLNEHFNQDYSQGVAVNWESDFLRAQVMFHDGIGQRNTAATATTTEYAFAGRAEFKAAGSWQQFDDFSSWSGDAFGLLIGGAANWEKDEFGTAAPDEAERFLATVDAQVEFGGANLFGAFIYSNPDMDGPGDSEQIGFVVQGGIFLIPDQGELFGRYEWADPDNGGEDLSLITVGFNWYFAKHSAKWQTDVGWSLNTVDGNWAASGTSWLTDAATQEDQVVIRTQWQLLF